MLRFRILSFVFAALVFLQGCSMMRPMPRVKTFETYGEAGRVIVGTQTIAPFEDYIDLLQPKFLLSPADALSLAIPQTQSVRTRELRELLVALQLAFPVTAHSETASTTTTGGSTRTVTDSSTSPSAPAAAIPDAISRSLAALAVLDSAAVQSDAMLKYRAATALYQEVALLSSYLRDAAVSRNAVPYIARQLVTVLPSSRRAPYDAHLTLGYFAAGDQPIPYFDRGQMAVPDGGGHAQRSTTAECAGKAISVIPLFVTDSIETSLIQADRAGASDLGFSAGGASTAVGFGVGARSKSESSEESVSRELNSILTVGRAADNALTMRIGATFVENTFNLVPRTFNVTVLVLAPFDRSNNEIPCPQVRYSVESEFVDARSGKVLPRASLSEIGATMAKLSGESKGKEVDLLEATIANRFDSFRSLMCPSGSSSCSDDSVHRLWVRYVREVAASGLGSGSFDLPSRQTRFFSAETKWNDVVEHSRNAVLDDGKAATLRVSGGYGLTDGTIQGTIRFKSKEREIEFIPSVVKVEGGGRMATITFPSIHKVDPEVKEATVTLLYSPSEQRWFNEGAFSAWRASVPVVAYKEDSAKKPEPQFEVLPSSDQLRVTSAAQGQLALTFKRAKKPSPDFSTVFFSVRGGHIVSAMPTLGSSQGAYQASTDTIYNLSLGGLVPGSKLRVEAWRLEPKEDGKAGETVAVSAAPVELFVVGPESTKEVGHHESQ